MKSSRKIDSLASPDVALAVVIDEDRVLMLERRDDAELSWVFPGGKVAPGESPENAARRELYEEAGILCNVSRSIGTRVHPDTHRVIGYFLCEPQELSARVMEPHLFSNVSWMTLSELEASIKTSLFAPVRAAISEKARKYGGRR
ncbi:NUDIX hydrolase [Rhizobium sp. S152]|uniref:NUDIX hydrolase n=1 Tax=Rhizobium sp. S152 TaxID=3055038 RepID=UPI0025A93116|nr:NUDIX hydrolase [Rhizobium sp. S152]MDM9628103.1 NUDIX hydrolase [Rhizobium sp. S152]